jgi:hypothetical protein
MWKVCEAARREERRRATRGGRPNGSGGKPRAGNVAVAPFTERALELHEAGLLSWNELSRRTGMDTRHLHRTLGLKAETTVRWRRTNGGRLAQFRYRYLRSHITPMMAKRLMTALEMDPIDVGL